MIETVKAARGGAQGINHSGECAGSAWRYVPVEVRCFGIVWRSLRPSPRIACQSTGFAGPAAGTALPLAVSECGKDGVAFSDDAAAMIASPPEGFVSNASAMRQTREMYSSKSDALAEPGAGVAGLGGEEPAEGRAELDGCPEVAGALAMPGAGAAEPGGGDAAGGPAEVDGSGRALAELGAGCPMLEAAAGSR